MLSMNKICNPLGWIFNFIILPCCTNEKKGFEVLKDRKLSILCHCWWFKESLALVTCTKTEQRNII